MEGSLYERDFLAWTQQQAAALRRLSARGGGDDAGLDLENLIEEVETLGRSEVSKVRTALRHLLEHAAFLALAGPDHQDARNWRGEMVNFRADTAEDYRPSMRQLLEPRLAEMWATAREAAARKLGRPVSDLSEGLPFGLEDLLGGLPLDGLAEAIAARMPPPPGD